MRFYNSFLVQELRSEVENLASRVLYMQEAKEDIRSDIAVMKRAADKAHGEVTQAEQLKKKQVRGLDFYFPDARLQ
jgi:outer membrane murein-binding lipoprotein Lpp